MRHNYYYHQNSAVLEYKTALCIVINEKENTGQLLFDLTRRSFLC